jgi:hypothetical protein
VALPLPGFPLISRFFLALRPYPARRSPQNGRDLTGFIKVRHYEKDGETKQIRQLVVTGARLEKMEIREQAA